MNYLGLLRVKNEERWIKESVESLLPLCNKVIVMDDHSTDKTADICAAIPNVSVLRTPFSTLNEARDKSWLLNTTVPKVKPDWVIMIDGDEVLASNGPDKIKRLTQSLSHKVISLQIRYLWNDSKTIRTDGVYGCFTRASLFKVDGPHIELIDWRFPSLGGPNTNLHCGNIPFHLTGERVLLASVNLWHYGYIDAAIRRRKYDWYTSIDPNNTAEDCYRHIIQGDPGGADAPAVLKHAGPLTLEPTSEQLKQL